jgi:hypothetical protein
LALLATAVAALILIRKLMPDATSIGQSAAGILIMANCAWVMLTPWGLHFLGIAIGLLFVAAALWVFCTNRLAGRIAAAVLLALAFSIYQQNVVLAGAVWLLYLLSAQEEKNDFKVKSTFLWLVCMGVAVLAYFAMLKWGFGGTVATGEWRNVSVNSSPVDRLRKIDLKLIPDTLGDQYRFIVGAWLLLAIVGVGSSPARWRNTAALIVIIAAALIGCYVFELVLGMKTSERMLMSLFLVAFLAPVVVARGRIPSVILVAGALALAFLVSERAAFYHDKNRSENQHSLAYIEEVYSRIENSGGLPIVLVGNRIDCPLEGEALVFCNYWRSYVFRSVMGNKRIYSLPDIENPARREFAESLPVYPAPGFSREHDGFLFARIGPEFSW